MTQSGVAEPDCAVQQRAATEQRGSSDFGLRILHTLQKCNVPLGGGNTYSSISERITRHRPSIDNSVLAEGVKNRGGASFLPAEISGGFEAACERPTTYTPIDVSGEERGAQKNLSQVVGEKKPPKKHHLANSLSEKCTSSGSKASPGFGSKSGPVFGSKSGPTFGSKSSLVQDRKLFAQASSKKSKLYRSELNSQGSENNDVQRAEFASLLADSGEEGPLEAELKVGGATLFGGGEVMLR